MRSRAISILSLFFLCASTSCNKPLNEDECRTLVNHLVDLVAKGEGGSDAERIEKLKGEVKSDKHSVQNIRDTCVGKMTKSQFVCVMKANTFEEAVACDAK